MPGRSTLAGNPPEEGPLKPIERLTEGLRLLVEESDYAAAVSVSEASARSVGTGGMRSSATVIALAQVVEREIANRLPAMFQIYNQERERFWSDRSILKEPVLEAIERFFDLARRHVPDQPMTAAGNRTIYLQLLDEARGRLQAQAEGHFLHPGLRPWHERNALKVAGISALLGAIATKVVGG